MHRSTTRRRSAARIIGWGFVASAYVATLVFATSLSTCDSTLGTTADQAGQAVAGAVAVAPSDTGRTLASAAATAADAEAPLVTLVIALGLTLAAFAGYAVHSLRTRRPPVRRARLIVRYLMTLM
jgi:hypothetical protein